jgi:hypothetical protein
VAQLGGDLTKARRVQPLDGTGEKTFSYGCLFLGADPLGAAWPRGRRIFSIDGINRPSAVDGQTLGASDYQCFDRVHWGSFFQQHPNPPDVLAVRVPKDPDLQSDWEHRFLDRPAGKKPKYLVVVEQAGDLLRNHSSACRARLKRFQRAGYMGVLKHVDSSRCGSPTWGSFFVTIYYQESLGIEDNLALKLIGDLDLLPRGFENCRKPVGVARNL